eukprot:m.269358 g.269358  ORF g.269358 m.269358 type:complete len:707 (+) comp40535_c0_seq3:31-2151(+)
MDDDHDFFFKVFLIGDMCAGKSSFFFRITHDDVDYNDFVGGPTIGIHFEKKTLELHGKRINLHIFDTSGQARFRFSILPSHYRTAKGLLLFYNITDETTFDTISEILQDIDRHAPPFVEKVLLGSMCDCGNRRRVSREQGQRFALKHGMPFFEISAKTGVGIKEAFMCLVDNMMRKRSLIAGLDVSKIYKEAVEFGGSVPVIRSRLVVVGPDGAGKTSFVDSLLGREFKEDRPSTDGVAFNIAVKEAFEEWQEEAGDGIPYMDKHIVRATAHRVELGEGEGFSVIDDVKSETGVSESASNISTKRTKPWTIFSKIQAFFRRIFRNSTNLKLSEQQGKLFMSKGINQYLKSLRTKHIWDLGGQETYLATHTALMSIEGKFTVTAYALVFDLSKSLKALAQSHFRGADGEVVDLTDELNVIREYGDFLRHWLASFKIAHPSRVPSPYLGENEGIESPPVFGVATRADVPAAMEMLEGQSQAFSEIVKEMEYEGHLVNSGKDGEGGLFLISNNLSNHCPGVKAFQKRIDAMDEHYWSQQDPMPIRWLPFEESLISWKEGKVIHLNTVVDVGINGCAIPNEEEVIAALQYLHNLGVIQYFSTVASVRDVVFIDPVWLVEAVASFVTSRKPSEPRFLPDWRKLKETGEMSRELTEHCLQQSDSVPSSEHETVLKVLEMIDVAYQSISCKWAVIYSMYDQEQINRSKPVGAV